MDASHYQSRLRLEIIKLNHQIEVGFETAAPFLTEGEKTRANYEFAISHYRLETQLLALLKHYHNCFPKDKTLDPIPMIRNREMKINRIESRLIEALLHS